MLNFKKLSRFDRIMAAMTFAEAGEAETAIQLMSMDNKNKRKRIGKAKKKHIDQRPVMRA